METDKEVYIVEVVLSKHGRDVATAAQVIHDEGEARDLFETLARIIKVAAAEEAQRVEEGRP